MDAQLIEKLWKGLTQEQHNYLLANPFSDVLDSVCVWEDPTRAFDPKKAAFQQYADAALTKLKICPGIFTTYLTAVFLDNISILPSTGRQRGFLGRVARDRLFETMCTRCRPLVMKVSFYGEPVFYYDGKTWYDLLSTKSWSFQALGVNIISSGQKRLTGATVAKLRRLRRREVDICMLKKC